MAMDRHLSTIESALLVSDCPQEVWGPALAEVRRLWAHEEGILIRTLDERDDYHEWADKLANAIAAHTGDEIGEHSNLNNPWAKALELIDGQRCR